MNKKMEMEQKREEGGAFRVKVNLSLHLGLPLPLEFPLETQAMVSCSWFNPIRQLWGSSEMCTSLIRIQECNILFKPKGGKKEGSLFRNEPAPYFHETSRLGAESQQPGRHRLSSWSCRRGWSPHSHDGRLRELKEVELFSRTATPTACL